MLSVQCRDEDRGLGKNRMTELGFVGAHEMEENELEEGEAYSYRDEDSDHNPDVDVDLSYIDEKIRNVLGHFQKDFEEGVSAENLGAKFGGYGSFLQSPCHPHTVSQPGSSVRIQPPCLQIHGDQPFVQSHGVCQRTTHQPIASVPTTFAQMLGSTQLTTSATALDVSVVKDVRMHAALDVCSAGLCSPKGDAPMMKPASCNAKKSLKVRLKVPSCPATKNNAEIYSVLGLDILPSSSLEESSGYSLGLPLDDQEAPDVSPTTILQSMTSSPTPGGFLSPLSDSMLQLIEKGNLFRTDIKSGSSQKDGVDFNQKDYTVKKVERPSNPSKTNHLDAADDKGITMFMKKEINTDAPDGLTSKLSLSAEVKEKGKTAKSVGKLGKPGEMGNVNVRIEEKCSSFVAKKKKVVDTTESKELVLESVKPLPVEKKDNPLGKMDMQGAGYVRKSAHKILDLFGDDEDTLTPESVPVSDYINMEMKEIRSTPLLNKFDMAGKDSVPKKALITLKANLTDRPLLDQGFLDNANTDCSKDTNGNVFAKSNAWEDIVRGKKKINDSSKCKIVENKLTCESVDKMRQEGNERLSSGKSRQNHDHSAGKSFSESSKSKNVSSASHKHKTKTTNARLDVHEAQPDMRLQESNRKANTDYCNNPTGNAKTEHAKGRLPVDSSDNSVMGSNIKDATISNSGHNEIELFRPLGKPIEIAERKASQNASADELNGEGVNAATMSVNGTTAVTVTNSLLITDEWVCCDKCQKWRLLPYGLQRPKEKEKWVCKMQTWLPGLNKCNVSKEDGIKAFYALYQIEDHQNGLHSQKDQNGGNAPLTGGQNLQSNLLGPGSVSDARKKHLQEEQNDSGFIVDLPNSTKKNLQSLVKSDNGNHHSLDPNPLDNVGLLHVGKAPVHAKEKWTHKHQELELLGSYSDGGEPIGQDFYSKSKGKRELLQSNHGDFKKIKRDRNELGRTNNGTMLDGQNALKHSDHCSSSKDSKCDAVGNDIHLGRMVKNHNKVSFNGECNVKPGAMGLEKLDNDEISIKKRKMEVRLQVQETGESSANKWRSSDVTAPKSTVHESEHRKEKKSKSSKFDGRESSTSVTKMDKKGRSVRVVPYSGGDLVFDETNGGSCAMHEKEQNVGALMGSSVSRRISESSNPLKMDAGCTQHSDTSSSSKFSGSQKIKVIAFEVKGSPVESVSSSPLRTTNGNKIMIRKNHLGKDDLVNVCHDTGSNLGHYSNGEVDRPRKDKNSSAIQHSVQDDKIGNKSSLDAHRKKFDQDIDKEKINPVTATSSALATKNQVSVECGNNHGAIDAELESQIVNGLKIKGNGLKIKNYDKGDVFVHVKSAKGMPSLSKDKKWENNLQPGKGFHDSYDENLAEIYSIKDEQKTGVQSSAHQAERYILHSKGGAKFDKDFENDVEKNVKCSGKEGNNVRLIAKNPDKLDTGGSPFAKQQTRPMVGKSEAVHNKDGKSLHSNPQEPIIGLERKFFNQNLSNKTNQTVLVSDRDNIKSLSSPGNQLQGQRSKFSPRMGSRLAEVDVSNSAASKPCKQSRQHDDTNVAVNGGVRHFAANGLVNKEPDAVRNILKEATNVKHSADRLRNGGLELDSIGLYFSAALKFLHAASLSEPNDEVAKQGDNSSMKVYVDTAMLCRFCALMCEKHKDMAAAALAYKCMEVAFMRVIFLKHYYANNVRQELQALVPNVIGESPSSSASDVDSLNNSGMPERLRQLQGVSSPQMPTNLVISASSRRSFDWLLNLANDVNLAMDALRRSHNAFSAASGNLENVQYRPEGISSVRRVIEFNFHDVEGFLRLVRLSLEEIGH